MCKKKDYLEWKYCQLKDIAGTKILRASRRKKLSNKTTVSLRFWTKQYFRVWRDIFYFEGRKVIPKNICQLLTPLVMAVWFMDDGYLKKANSVALSTDRFSDSDLEFLRQALNAKYGILPSIVKSKKLYFGKMATEKFISIIEPFIIPSMMYKLP